MTTFLSNSIILKILDTKSIRNSRSLSPRLWLHSDGQQAPAVTNGMTGQDPSVDRHHLSVQGHHVLGNILQLLLQTVYSNNLIVSSFCVKAAMFEVIGRKKLGNPLPCCENRNLASDKKQPLKIFMTNFRVKSKIGFCREKSKNKKRISLFYIYI